MQELYTLQDICVLVSVGVRVCLGWCVSKVDCRDQMCVLHVCVNKESDMYTPACTYLLMYFFKLRHSLKLCKFQSSTVKRLMNALSFAYALNR